MTDRRAPRWRRVDGVLLLDKPAGVSSNAALQRARRLLAAEKAGHTGTLDPLASGLLPVCFGEATKFAQSLLDAEKRYRATVRFGASTTTGDAEGEVVERAPVGFDRTALEAALARFTGRIRQVPPAYSALKHQGRPLYDYARKGVDVPREAREVEIRALTLVDWTHPDAVVDVACSKGTYVRTLAEDLGRALGTHAHLAALTRTGTGGFELAEAIGIDALEALPEAQRLERLRPVDALLTTLPRLDLAADAARALRCGQTVAAPEVAPARYRAYDATGAFVGVVGAAGGRLIAERMMRTGEGVAPAPAAGTQIGRST
jgi:tRNA pseudouridine55 synthase